MPKIIAKQNIEKDAWNWWNACNKISYGEDWKQRIDKKLQNKLAGKTREQLEPPSMNCFISKLMPIGRKNV